MPLAVKVDTLCRKSASSEAPKRLSAVAAKANLAPKKSQTQERKSKLNQLSREELDEIMEESKRNYEACKSIKEDFDRSFQKEDKRRPKKSSKKVKTEPDSEKTKSSQSDPDPSSMEVDTQTSAKSELDSSGSYARNSDDTMAMSSGLSSPVSLDFDLNVDESMVMQEKMEYYQELKTYDLITILADSTNKSKTPSDLQIIQHIVHRLKSFYDELEQFRSRANHQETITDGQNGPMFKLKIFDVARLLRDAPPSSGVDSELMSKLANEHIDIQLADSFGDALGSDLVLSLLQPKDFSLGDESEDSTTHAEPNAVDLFEELLFASDLRGVKLVSMGCVSFTNVMFYHHYFKDNKGLFIEAPLSVNCKTCDDRSAANFDSDWAINCRIYSACLNHSFFYSVKYLLDAIAGKKNVIFKSSKLGFPSNYAAALSQPQANAVGPVQ